MAKLEVNSPEVEIIGRAYLASSTGPYRPGPSPLGHYDNLEEALLAVRGQGEYGSDGTVAEKFWVRLENGLIRERQTPIYGRRESIVGPIGWEDGFLDYRDLADVPAEEKREPVFIKNTKKS